MHEAWRQIIAKEPSLRAEAAKKFPGDPWSQDDDFHNAELREARAFANRQGVQLGDVLRALDDGMHEHWPASPPPQAKVPPCRPRLTY
jgi:hypothetical protein